MAFLAPLIGVALSAAGVGALGSALITTALGVGASFLSNRIRGKEQSRNANVGARVGLTIDTNAPRQWVVGQTSNGGSLVFWHLSGTNNEKLWLVIALADHECQSLQSVIVAGKIKGWDDETGEVADFNGKLKVRFYSGAPGQTADAGLVAASGGRWLSTAVGVGMCYVVVEAVFDEKLFPGGIPELGFEIRGAKLYDTRTSTTAYSANAALAVYAAARGVSVEGQPLIGMSVPAGAIRSAEMDAAANICDEDVALGGGGAEDRYRVGCVLDSNMSNQDVLETLLAAMAGEIIEAGGIYRIMAGAARTPVASLTDDDFITLANGSPEPMKYRPKRGRNQLVNAVSGTYYEPTRNYAPVASPLRVSSLDVAADAGFGGRLTLDLSAVTSRTQAQRILEIERRKARRMGVLDVQLRAFRFGLEVGDWVSITSARRGFENKVFDIEGAADQFDLRKSCTLTEMDDEFDDWSTDLEIDDTEVADLPPAGPSLSSVSGVDLDAIVVSGAGDEQRPALQIEWTPITDPTVVSLKLEYRIIGDTVAIERNILDPGAGTYTWLDGVQGGVTYEARLKPITRPERGTVWSAWISSASEAPPQVVSLAAEALYIDPSNIPPAELDAQSAFELMLVTASEAVQNSVNARLDDAIRRAELAASAAIGVAAENTMLLRSVRATSGANAIAITETLDAFGGADQLAARWAVAIDVNGNVTGLVQLSGDLDYTQFSVLADKFSYAMPGGDGTPFPVFSIVTLEGEQVAVLNGDLIANAIKAGLVQATTVDAVFGSFGVMTAGIIRDEANTYQIQVANGLFTSTDGKAYLDLKNKRLRFTP